MVRIIIAAAGLILAGSIFFFFTQPTFDDIQAIQKTITDDNAALQKAAELQTLKQNLLSRYNSFNPGDLDRLQKMLPDHVDNVRLILDLDHLAGQHNLQLQGVDISGNTSSAGPSAGAQVGSIGAGPKYDTLDLKFSTSGTYANFLSFMSDLESSLRLVDLESLQLSGGGQQNAGVSSDPGSYIYTYNLALRTYWLK